MLHRVLLLTASFALIGCQPAAPPTPDAANDAAADAATDVVIPQDSVCPPGGIGCLSIRIRDAVTNQDVPDAVVIVAAEIGRDVGNYAGGAYGVRSGCTGSFVITVERMGYERFVGTYRSFRDRDFTCNQEFQVIEIRIQPLASGPRDG